MCEEAEVVAHHIVKALDHGKDGDGSSRYKHDTAVQCSGESGVEDHQIRATTSDYY